MGSSTNPSNSFDPKNILQALTSLLESLPPPSIQVSTLRASLRTQLRQRIEELIDGLESFLVRLDPVQLPPHVLDPSDPSVVGQLIAETLLTQDRYNLDSIQRFYGSGVYAIYYSGAFDAYEPVSGTETPLYVGKADPASHGAITPIQQGQRLWSRLYDHRKSIKAARNLNINDFDCRYLAVRSAWQGTAETYLISKFLPIWNNETKICYGFGKHGDAHTTRANTRSPWDTLHPGRNWATKEGNRPYKLSDKQIKALIADHFRKHPPQPEVDL